MFAASVNSAMSVLSLPRRPKSQRTVLRDSLPTNLPHSKKLEQAVELLAVAAFILDNNSASHLWARIANIAILVAGCGDHWKVASSKLRSMAQEEAKSRAFSNTSAREALGDLVEVVEWGRYWKKRCLRLLREAQVLFVEAWREPVASRLERVIAGVEAATLKSSWEKMLEEDPLSML